MSLQSRDMELEDERATQRAYAQELQRRDSVVRRMDGPRNNRWTGTGLPPSQKFRDGELIGRVALVAVDSEIGRSEYYIGERYAEFDGMAVFSWATRIASTFFRGAESHPLRDEVAIIRSFKCTKSEIVDFADDVIRGPETQGFSRRRKALNIPAPPTKRLRPKPGQSVPNKVAKPAEPIAKGVQSRENGENSSNGNGRNANLIRAEQLLRARLAAPRAAGLTSVLSTLQPDQYDLVARPAMDNVIVQGPPGTGKTIIAAHRAAYMINAEPENSLDGDVLLIGPTPGYSEHVKSAVTQLTGEVDRVKVIALSNLMRELAGTTTTPKGEPSRCRQDADRKLGEIATAAVERCGWQGDGRSMQTVYDALRANWTGSQPVTDDQNWAKYLKYLPTWEKVREERAQIPLLACIAWRLNPHATYRNIEHIIVDEAQDLTGIEWFLLEQMNLTRAWTIIGDLNQRRSDHTCASWQEMLEIAKPNGDTPIESLVAGYRSTKPILDFAGLLLPSNERTVAALQLGGSKPLVIDVSESILGAVAVRQAQRLARSYPNGTVALIATATEGAHVIRHMRSDGWQKSPESGQPRWRKGGRTIAVMHHDAARGLEFDGVVVVDPASFPKDRGRHGPLYTALTRPNRELVVVHSNKLPGELSGTSHAVYRREIDARLSSGTTPVRNEATPPKKIASRNTARKKKTKAKKAKWRR